MTRIPFPKEPLTLEKHIDCLKERGMVIKNDDDIKNHLATIGYYRLSAYWHPFRICQNDETLDNFEPGTKWKTVMQLYEFDRRLRLLVMDAIERVEVSVRARITHHFALRYGTFGYLKKSNFHPKFKYSKWLKNIKEAIKQAKDKEDFLQHYREKYSNKNIPVWMMTEVVSFGNLSRFYKGLKIEDKIKIANYFDMPAKQDFARWLHVVSYVRNICAHHSRLWNRKLAIRPAKTENLQHNDRIFCVLLILHHLMKVSNNGEDWKKSIDDLINEFQKNTDILKMMKMPKDYQNRLWWRK